MRKKIFLGLFLIGNLFAAKGPTYRVTRDTTAFTSTVKVKGNFEVGSSSWVNAATWVPYIVLRSTGEIEALYIKASTITARNNDGIRIIDNGGNIWLTLVDGGQITIGTPTVTGLFNVAQYGGGITIFGFNDSGTGIHGNGGSGTGVRGSGDTRGVYGFSYDGHGVHGAVTDTNVGWAGYFEGNVFGTGYSSHTFYYGDGSNLTNLPLVSTATYAVNAGTAVYSDNTGLLSGRNYDSFVSTAGDSMSGKLKIRFPAGHGGGALEVGAATNSATGENAIAFGDNTTASGDDAISLGINTEASGTASFSAGFGSKASGGRSRAFGINTVAAGDQSTVFGRELQCLGDFNFGIALADVNNIAIVQPNIMAVMGGNFGVNTTTPTHRFQVDGQIHCSSITVTASNMVIASTVPYAQNAGLLSGKSSDDFVATSGDTMSGNLIVNASVTVDDLLILGNIPAQVLIATSTILSADSFYNISSTADIVITSTPSIIAGTDGQFLILQNTGTYYIDIQDDAVLAGSGVFYGGSSAVIAPKDIITFLFDSAIGGWVIQSHPNLQVAGANADVILVRNTSGATIPALSAVYAAGYNVGQHRILIDLADADDPSKMPAIGLTPNSIADGANGSVVTSGIIEENLSVYSLGDILYSSTTAGALTNARPATDAIQALAIVTRASVNGSLLVTGAGRTNDVPIDFTANQVTVSSLTITGANVILKATATHSLNSDLLDGYNFDAFGRLGDTHTWTGGNNFQVTSTMTILHTTTIRWADGTVQVSSPTVGVGNGGQPDITFSYMGDVFNSTSPWKLNPQVSKYAFTTARYDIDIGSATADTFSIRFAKKSFGGSYTAFQDVTIPVNVSSHTITGSAVSILDGDIVIWGFLDVDASNPVGEVSVIIRD